MTPGATVTLSATSASVYVLVLPGTYSQAPTLAINLNEGGTSAIAVPAASLTTTTFAAGSKYTYAVSIARTAITISNPTITDWTNVNGSRSIPACKSFDKSKYPASSDRRRGIFARGLLMVSMM